jgi:PAS domain S-box-containing protein
MVGSVLLRDGCQLRHASAPHVPEGILRAVEGLEIGDNRGICGTCAHLRQPVFSEDLTKDPRCGDFWKAAAENELHACWSMPILDGKQSVLGTIALYGAKPALPSEKDRRLLESVAHTASIAIGSHADQAARSESEEKFSKVFRASPDAVSISDLATGRIIEANPSFENLFGFARKDLLGRSIDEIGIYANRLDRDDWIRSIKSNGSVRGREMRLSTRLGSVVTCIVGGELIELGGRTHVVTVIHDITERLQLQENLRQAQKMDAIGQLSGGIAHDFNNLLTVIMGNLGLIRVTGELTPAAAESLEQIAYAANRAANLTRQLLEFSRKRVLLRQDLDLNEVIGSFSKMLRRVIGETVEFELLLTGDRLPVSADRAMIEQVMLNLCLNARDAMPKGGKLTLATQSIRIGADDSRRSPASRAGSFALLTVTDTGTGIDPGHLEHIFEPFFTTKEVGKGTGLGLASVYGILQQHQGWVSVRSELGKGTIFDVHLPLLESSTSAKSLPVSPTEVSGGNERILLVEDDIAVRLVAQKALSQLGYRVLVASDGNEARALWSLNRGAIDLLVTDMVMPGGLGGGDIAREFKSEAPSLKVIFMSGYSADIAGTDFRSQGSDSFLGKPFSVQELAAMVRRRLSSAPSPGVN